MVVLVAVLAVRHQRLEELLLLVKVMRAVVHLVMVVAVVVALAQQAVTHQPVLALAAMAQHLLLQAHL
jgi:hypothetical protein